jgi:hypothetical protein
LHSIRNKAFKFILVITILLKIVTSTVKSAYLSDCNFISNAFNKKYEKSDSLAVMNLLASDDALFCFNGICTTGKDINDSYKELLDTKLTTNAYTT